MPHIRWFVLGSTSIPLSSIYTQVSRTVTAYLTTVVHPPGKNLAKTTLAAGENILFGLPYDG